MAMRPIRSRSSSLPGSASLGAAVSGGATARQHVRNLDHLLDNWQITQLLETSLPKALYTSRAYSFVGKENGPDPAILLCTPCRMLMENPPEFIPFWVYGGSANPPSSHNPQGPDHTRHHHESLLQLIDCCYGSKSRSKGCQLCHLMWHGICRRLAQRRRLIAKGRKLDGIADIGPDLNCHDGIKVAVDRGTTWSGIILNILLGDGWSGLKLHEWFQIKIDHEPGFSRQRNPKSLHTDSPETIAQIREWIDNCDKNHTLCSDDSAHTFHPSRLLSISDDANTIQLIEPSHNSLPYTALSYRWGNPSGKTPQKPLMLETNTWSRLKSGVAVGALPRTIRDAVIATHRIGYQALWVDRLCILQDSEEDWSAESSQMANVYKHAALVIAASCAAGEEDGFFRCRKFNGGGNRSIWLRSNLFRDKSYSGPDTTSIIHVPREGKQSSDWNSKIGHLNHRGWCYQERILARRIIHYAEHEVYWECRELEACEGHPAFGDQLRITRPCIDLSRRSLQPRWHDGIQPWHEVIATFTGCALTYETDRLIAFSGLAKEKLRLMQEEVPDEVYYAGLWKTTFVADLCWNGEIEASDEAAGYVAPTWSWASIPSLRLRRPIWWGVDEVFADKYEYHPYARLIEAKIKTVGDNSFAPVLDGWAIIHGRLRTIRITPKETYHWPEPHQSKFRVQVVTQTGDLPILGTMSLATLRLKDFMEEQTLTVECLPLRRVKSFYQQYEIVFCLLLAPNGAIRYANRSQNANNKLNAPDTYQGRDYQRIGFLQLEVREEIAMEAWIRKDPMQDVLIR